MFNGKPARENKAFMGIPGTCPNIANRYVTIRKKTKFQIFIGYEEYRKCINM